MASQRTSKFYMKVTGFLKGFLTGFLKGFLKGFKPPFAHGEVVAW